MTTFIQRVERAIEKFKNGEMIILTDDPSRENEGDLIVPAEKITPAIMNFMIRNGSGIVCLAMTENDLKHLELPLMLASEDNTSCRGTPFTVSIDAKENITTGVSAEERALTILAAIHPNAKPEDLVKPGHIFPLQAQSEGVFQRQGHTEGSVDLARIGGFKPAAVLCEIMNPDGSMTRGAELNEFALKHGLHMLTIEDVINYRFATENLIVDQAETTLPIDDYGSFKMKVIKEKISNTEHIVLVKENVGNANKLPTLVRIHSACATGDIFASKRCDCHHALQHSLKRISEEGGILIYLNQEGRGIGLLNKIKAYALQDAGLDTVEANEKLGLPVDSRTYHLAANVLKNMQVSSVRLLTNNPNKLADLQKFGITTLSEPMPVFSNEHNEHYLKIKKEKMKHTFHLV